MILSVKMFIGINHKIYMYQSINSYTKSGWEKCHYCEGLFAVIDAKSCTCGPTCNANLFIGLCKLQQSYVDEVEMDNPLNEWLLGHPKIKATYEKNTNTIAAMVEFLKGKTRTYDPIYMKSLLNKWK